MSKVTSAPRLHFHESHCAGAFDYQVEVAVPAPVPLGEHTPPSLDQPPLRYPLS
ncbi:MAG TPA: hypothetical protein VIQ74_07250 [Gemmatimonadaceae bacterium]|jgi:hypothetical protein